MENIQGQVNTVANNTTTQSPVQSKALDYLLSDTAVSSLQEDTSTLINRAEQSFQTNTQAAAATRDFTKGRAEMTFQNEADTLTQQGLLARQGMRESRGLASAMSQFQVFDDTINKQMNNLKLIKEDALRAADMDYYTRVSQAEMNLIETQVKATDSMFQKLFGIAGISQQQQSFQLAQRAQKFNEQEKLGSIALEYGLDLRPGETIDQVITRAMPLASEQKRLELNKLRAEINAENARAAQINYEIKSAKNKDAYLSNLSEENIALQLQRGMSYTDLVGEKPTNEHLTRVNNAYTKVKLGGINAEVSSIKKEGVSRDQAFKAANESLTAQGIQLTPEDEIRIKQSINDIYGEPKNGIFGDMFKSDKQKSNERTYNTIINSNPKLSQTQIDQLKKQYNIKY